MKDKEKQIEMPTGWLAPNGDLYKCGFYEHNATAEEICNKLKIKYNEYSYHGKDDALLSLGWCKLAICSLGKKQYWVFWERPLTAYQRYFLKDYFENEKDLPFPIDITSVCKYFHEDEFFKDGGEPKWKTN